MCADATEREKWIKTNVHYEMVFVKEGSRARRGHEKMQQSNDGMTVTNVPISSIADLIFLLSHFPKFSLKFAKKNHSNLHIRLFQITHRTNR